MPNLILTVAFLCCADFTFGQFTISGKVVDNEHKPIGFATVEVKKDSTIISSKLTDSTGNYNILQLPQGYYSILFSYINFQKNEINVNLLKDTVIDIQLSITSNNLKAVTVTSRKPLIERKVDRLIFNVENSINTVGTDALGVLEKTPGVRVDQNSISLIGKSDVSIMVDDRIIRLSGDALAAFLKSIPADAIARIEVITNPSAIYDAQGNSGLINIIKKQNKQLGYNGSITLGYSLATYSNTSSNIALNYSKQKTLLFANVMFAKGALRPFTTNTALLPEQTRHENSNRKEYSKFVRGTAGLEQSLTSRTSIGISYNAHNSKPDINEANDIKTYNTSGTLDSILRTNINTGVTYITQSLNLHVKSDLDSSGKKITIDADWFRNIFDQDRFFTNQNYFPDETPTSAPKTEIRSDHHRTTDLYSLNTNIDIPFKKFSFSTGFKLSFVSNNSNILLYRNIAGQYKIDSQYSNGFNYDEHIQAAYINASGKIKKWNWQAGLRTEYSQTKGVSPTAGLKNTGSYYRFFPTFYVSRALNKHNVFSINYGKRINRPGFQLFNPFRIYYSPYYYSEGNPYLKPSYSHNIELSNVYRNMLIVGVSYSRTVDQIFSLTKYVNGSNTQTTKPENVLSSSQYLFSSNVIYNKIKWLESNNSYYLYYNRSESSSAETDPVTKGWGGNIATRNSVFLTSTKTIAGAVDFVYQFPEVSGISRYKAYYTIDLGMRCLLWNKKWQVTLNIRDIFKTRTTRMEQVINNIVQRMEANSDSRRLVINLKYTFGSDKVKTGKTYSGSQTEQGRAY